MLHSSPIPPLKTRNRISKYDFGELATPDKNKYKEILTDKITIVRSVLSRYAIKHKMKFVTRKVEGGIRVWRVK